MGTINQQKGKKNSKTYFGTGKILKLQEMIDETEANLLVINDNLSGVQARNLNQILKIPLLERNQLILKIFAQRAQSYAGKLQIELAQKLDDLSRVRGAWLGSLSRQGGGIGSRGPGEKALETDRRQIQKRIKVLRKKLKHLKQDRTQQRKLRTRNDICSFALIGYTNSGKSTLFNRLTKARVATENQLFMTLDPTTRKVFIPRMEPSVLTDTVGFIQDLPHHLIDAFKGTLEESSFADVLLHVIDASNPNLHKQIKTTQSIIKEFGWEDKPIVYVYNKIDKLPSRKYDLLKTEFSVQISALNGKGIGDLYKEMRKAYSSLSKKITLFFPSNEEHKIDLLSQQAKIHQLQKAKGGTWLDTKISFPNLDYWKSFMTDNSG